MKKKKTRSGGFFNTFYLIFQEMEKKDKQKFVLLVFLALLSGFTLLIPAQVIAVIVSKITNDQLMFFGIKISSEISFMTLILVGGLLWLMSSIVRMIINSLSWRYSKGVVCNLKHRAFLWTITPRKNLDIKVTQGDATYRINSAIDEINDTLVNLLNTILPGMFSAIMAIVYICLLEPLSLPVLLVGAICIVILVSIRSRVERPIIKKNERENSRLGSFVVNALNNLTQINISQSEEKEGKLYKEKMDQYFGTYLKRRNVWKWYWICISVIDAMCIFAIILICSMRVDSGTMLAGNVILILNYVSRAFEPIENFGWFFGITVLLGVKIERVYDLKPKPSSLIDTSKDEKFPERIEKIELKNICVKISNDIQIKNVNLTLEKGKLTILTGASGGGKTTILRVLCGITERDKGEIVLNDKYAIHTMFSYINRFSIVMQSPYIFNRDLKDNILYPNTELNDKNNSFIAHLDMGETSKRLYNEDSEQNLENMLSGGEKKRVNVLRGLLRNKEVYIFDEPTNELDSKNTNKVLELINSLKENSIVMVVTHDKRMIDQADQVVEINNKQQIIIETQ